MNNKNMNAENIESYVDLLLAMINTEDGKGKMTSKYGFICTYDMQNFEKLVAIFNSSESCARFFNTIKRVIDSFVCRGQLKVEYTKFKGYLELKNEKEKKKNQYNFCCYMLKNYENLKENNSSEIKEEI